MTGTRARSEKEKMLCACYVFIMTFLAAACDMDDDEVLVERSFGVEFLVVT
jgi:hypothetical protein